MQRRSAQLFLVDAAAHASLDDEWPPCENLGGPFNHNREVRSSSLEGAKAGAGSERQCHDRDVAEEGSHGPGRIAWDFRTALLLEKPDASARAFNEANERDAV